MEILVARDLELMDIIVEDVGVDEIDEEDVVRGEALLGWTKAENKWLPSQLLWNAAKIFVCI